MTTKLEEALNLKSPLGYALMMLGSYLGSMRTYINKSQKLLFSVPNCKEKDDFTFEIGRVSRQLIELTGKYESLLERMEGK